MATTVGSVTLPNPIMTAAGTGGHGAELGAYMDLGSLGAVVVTHFEWHGNPPLRVHRTPAGMINSVGLQGPGVARWIREDLPGLERAGARTVVSIWGRTVADYEKAARLLADAADRILAVEVNISLRCAPPRDGPS